MSASSHYQFFEYLVEIDSIYCEYFKNRQDHIHSIIQCFGVFRSGKLLYFSSSNLDPYIQRIVRERFKELFGEQSEIETVA
ncbi:MAG TPA: hypothetical protein VK543_04410 [Puia sp.]|nr:hypothetical protein [Puia sp.]